MTLREMLLNESAVVSFSEIVTASGLSAEELNELIELGMCEPCGTEGTQPLFAANAIELARAARRLQIDFELPLAGVALVLAYRSRIRELEERLQLLECQLPGRAPD
jgi:MerR HTH family regulatory protein